MFVRRADGELLEHPKVDRTHRPELARGAWQVAAAHLQRLLEEQPELRARLVAKSEPIEEPTRRAPRRPRQWSTRPRQHLPRIEGLGCYGGRAYEY